MHGFNTNVMQANAAIMQEPDGDEPQDMQDEEELVEERHVRRSARLKRKSADQLDHSTEEKLAIKKENTQEDDEAESVTTTARKRRRSKTKEEKAEGKEPPADWEKVRRNDSAHPPQCHNSRRLQVWEGIAKMREKGDAPVDSMGCETLAEKAEPKVANLLPTPASLV